ncbi:MAG: AAA family ATPase [Acetobacteraceae bacterium]|nr:AAA family ATPase [Acetobacteraceae bacterium]
MNQGGPSTNPESGGGCPGRGAVWHRVDLHLHSPGVESFACPSGANLSSEAGRAEVVEKYLAQLASQNIGVAAITDYNGIRLHWFELLAAGAANRGMVLLPGVELSFRSAGKHGLHVLAVFDRDADWAGINRFLQALDRDPATPLFTDRLHRDIDPRGSIADVLKQVRDRFNCLLIFPHPEGDNGCFKTFKAQDAARLLKEVRPDAIEHFPTVETRKKAAVEVLGPDFWRYLSLVEFSDAKRIEEVGTRTLADGSPRATFIKLSATDVSALRLALHDPATRLSIGGIPRAPHARIVSTAVEGSGFLGNISIEWNDDLNVIIGGRGAGKSAILETLRYALALSPYSDESSRIDLVRHALGSGGKVTVVLNRPLGGVKSREYVVTRVLGEEPRVTEADTGKLVAIPPRQLLGPVGGPTILGQREIQAVSQSTGYRLALLDELIGDEARERANAVREAIEELRANAREILAARKALEKREEHRQRLLAIRHELDVYERHGVADKLKEVGDLRSDDQLLRTAGDTIRTVKSDWSAMCQDLLAALDAGHRGLLRGQSKQKALLEEAARTLAELRDRLGSLSKQGLTLLDEADRAFGAFRDRWKELILPLEEEINRIKREVRTDVLDPDRLLRLVEEQTALMPLLEDLDRMERRLADLLEKRRDLLARVADLRLEEHKLRRERADAISRLLQDRLLLRIEFKGHREEYKKRLAAMLKGAGLYPDAIDNIAMATDGIQLADAVQGGPEVVQERFGLTPAMAQRLVKQLTDDESRLFELQTIIPADAVAVYLRVDDEYRPLERLSLGQRATAILLLLFAFQGRTLVLDQPEDDLDNRFVYDDIVQILREQKGLRDPGHRRQIIAATHSANIPVLGDAELVLALEAREGRAHIIGRASIDDARIRELVKAVMEGGEEAFRRRAEKYGGVPPS